MVRAQTLLTPAGEIAVAPAQPADLDTVLAILEEAARWLAGKGIDQWRPGSFPRQSIADAIARGEVILARLGEEAVGTLTLQWSDELFWGAGPPDAGYLHKLAIRRAFAGQELGRSLLGWTERTVAAAGKQYLRLDCTGENEALCAYYERAGFAPRGERQGRGWRVRLYEKPV